VSLQLYNTLTRKKEHFAPIDGEHIRMYVCGPTVYDRPHLGNARSVVVYDVLYRLLNHLYPNVTYVRNITDVDDKINAAAIANGEPISALTNRVEGWFHDDMAALNCLSPTHEPRATAHIKQMIEIIEKLIKNGNAYVSQGHVLFAVNSYKDYGALSGRKLDELIAGSRIEVESYKHHPGDFVLWKPADAGDDPSSVFDSPWGKGRPGWHIECSAMSSTYLTDHFDIHGGGADLMFPHHENEIAQSCCATPGSKFSNVWVHNGFLTVGGEKMSKSLGNFTTVKDVLDKGIQGEVIRLALLSARYSEPLDWNEKLIHDAKTTLDKWYRLIGEHYADISAQNEFLNALNDDLNLPKAFSLMHTASPTDLKAMGSLLGFFTLTPSQWFKGEGDDSNIQTQIDARIEAKKTKSWAEADRIRKALLDTGIVLEDKPDGTTDWRKA
jgi:cysteinyl-tRNA synthetase